MKLENQVVSLELAKKLKELGVKQESVFWWHRSWDNINKKENEPYILFNNYKILESDYSAFTVAELLELLPAGTSVLKRTDIKTKETPRYYVEVVELPESRPEYNQNWWDKNPADACAKMLIHLLENNHKE